MIAPVFLGMLIFSAAFMIALALYCRKYKNSPVALPFQVLMYCAAFWSLTYALEILTTSLSLKVFWNQVRFLVIPFIPVIELWLVLAYLDKMAWARGWRWKVLLVIPAITALLAITGTFHTLFRYQYSMDTTGQVPVLQFINGPWFQVSLLYSYILVITGWLLLVFVWEGAQKAYKTERLLLLCALVLPSLTDILTQFGVTPVPGANITPAIFFVSGLIIAIALLKFGFMEIITIARSRVIDEMGAPMIILDTGGKVVDMNPAAGSLFGGSPQAWIGKQAREMATGWSEFITFCESGPADHAEFTRTDGQGTRTYSGRIDMLCSASGSPEGKLILLDDITDRRRAEEELQQRSATLSVLNNIITAANQAENLTELLDRILAESLRLLDFDAGGIYIVDWTTLTADVVHSRNLSREFLAEIQTVPIDKRPYDTLFIKNEPIITENYAQIAPGRSEKFGFRSMVSIPLISKGVTIGALNIGSLKRQEISEWEKQVLISIGREIGSSIAKMEADEEVKKSRNNVETLFNSIDEMMFVMDLQGNILSLNKAVSKRLSYTPGELNGTNVLLLHVPERRDEALQVLEGVIAGTVNSCQVPVLARDGTRIEVETTITRGRWSSMDVLICVTRDLTERRRWEKELILKDFAIESSINAIALTDLLGNLTYVNPAFLSIMGYDDHQEVLNKSVLSFWTSPDDTQQVFEGLQKQGHWSGEITGQRKDGTPIPVQVSINLIHETSGKPIAMMGSFVDITDRKLAEERLKHSEVLLRAMIESPQSIVIFSLDTGYRYLAFNEKHRETIKGIWGVDISTGMNMLDIIRYGDDREKARQNFDRALAGEHFTLIEEYGDEALSRRTWENTYSPVYNDNHEVIGLTVFVIDVTERNQAYEKLRESEARFNRLSEHSGTIAWEVDARGVFTYVSQVSETFLGYRPEELVGRMHFYDLHPEAGRDEFMKASFAVFERKEMFHDLENIVTARDGRELRVATNGIPVLDHDGSLRGYVGSDTDITERKQAEESLRQLSDRLSLAVRAGNVGIWDYDVVNNTLIWDDQMFTLYGTMREPFGGAYGAWRAGVHPDDRERGDAEIQAALSGEKEFDTVFRVLRPDGSIRTIRALAIVQRDDWGKPLRMVGTNWDITDYKNTEEALRRTNRKLNLLSTITRHDINNQLTVLIGFLGVLEDTGPGPLYNEYLHKATTTAERISTIIQFTKDYENIGINAPAWQECRTLVDTAADLGLPGQVRVRNDLPEGMEVFADQLIARVCYNLMDNAARHGGKITRVRFSAEVRDGEMVIVCEDDGVGVPAAEKERIFERGVGRNTGLGLFLSREILSITGITILETGRPGTGARFEITVPRDTWRTGGKHG